MGKSSDLSGGKFGRLTVIERVENDKHRNSQWLCECECGKSSIVIGFCLKNGNTTSCGCYAREERLKKTLKHGHAKDGKHSLTYSSWTNMIQRCENPKATYYSYYGEIGIEVCERWHDFEMFMEDMGERPSPYHSIEREDSSGYYDPSNCRWATDEEQGINRKIQTNNKSGYKGIRKSPTKGKWLAVIGFRRKTIHLGTFEKIEEAVNARCAAELKYWNKSS